MGSHPGEEPEAPNDCCDTGCRSAGGQAHRSGDSCPWKAGLSLTDAEKRGHTTSWGTLKAALGSLRRLRDEGNTGRELDGGFRGQEQARQGRRPMSG